MKEGVFVFVFVKVGCVGRGGSEKGRFLHGDEICATSRKSDSHPLAELRLDVVFSKNMLVYFLRHGDRAIAVVCTFTSSQWILAVILLCETSLC